MPRLLSFSAIPYFLAPQDSSSFLNFFDPVLELLQGTLVSIIGEWELVTIISALGALLTTEVS